MTLSQLKNKNYENNRENQNKGPKKKENQDA